MHPNVLRCAAGLLLALTSACERSPTAAPTPTTTSTPTTTPTSTSTPTPASPSTAGDASAGGAMPPIETACKTDAECDIYMEGSAADPCCPKCTTYKGATKASLARFRAACRSMCGGSCATPPTHAACRAGQCVAVIDP